jgi:hypothetical protein
MSRFPASGSLCALILLGASAGSLRAADCPATEVCWWHRCRPAVSCYPAAPCGTQVCYYEPCRCGPIRRLLGLCRPTIVVCRPACVALPSCPAPACAPAPCPSCAAPAPHPVEVAPVQPAPVYAPPPATPGPAQPTMGSSYRPHPLPVRVPASLLTPPQAPAPVRLDRMVSFPGQ